MSKRRQTDIKRQRETYVEPDRSELASIHLQPRPVGAPDSQVFRNLQYGLGSGSVPLSFRMRLRWIGDNLLDVYGQ